MPKSNTDSEQSELELSDFLGVIALAIGSYAILRTGGYRIVMHAYPKKGGGGIKLVKPREKLSHPKQNPNVRIASMDFHTFFHPYYGAPVRGLHFHWGKSARQRNLHRTLNFPFGVEKASPRSKP